MDKLFPLALRQEKIPERQKNGALSSSIPEHFNPALLKRWEKTQSILNCLSIYMVIISVKERKGRGTPCFLRSLYCEQLASCLCIHYLVQTSTVIRGYLQDCKDSISQMGDQIYRIFA